MESSYHRRKFFASRRSPSTSPVQGLAVFLLLLFPSGMSFGQAIGMAELRRRQSEQQILAARPDRRQ